MAKKGPKFYVVWKGRKPGIYTSWDDCQRQIAGFPGAQYKSFTSKAEAEKALKSNYWKYTSTGQKSQPKSSAGIIKDSLSVDAACSGNPGVLEYRGVATENGRQIFAMGPFPEGTVNIGEFLAIVHGLAWLQKQQLDIPIYSDSMTALAWVRKKKANTKLERTSLNAELFELVDRAELWLKNNQWNNPILKWETSKWGEIPADYGRK